MFPEMAGRERHSKPRRRWRAISTRRSGECPTPGHRNPLPGLLPTLLTLSNGVCGLGSIAIAAGALGNLPLTSAAFFAALLIFLGMLFDMLDGQVARALKQASPFGAQLDSLCDAITFGAAPVFILLAFQDIFHPRFLFGIGVVYAACVLLRLARFNVETGEEDSHDYFTGLPSPAAAGTIASFALAWPGLERWSALSDYALVRLASEFLISSMMVTLPLLSLLLSWLMVSRVCYGHVVNRWIARRYRFYQLSRAALIIIAVLTVHELAVPLVFCMYALGPAWEALWKQRREGRATRVTDEQLDATRAADDQLEIDACHRDATT